MSDFGKLECKFDGKKIWAEITNLKNSPQDLVYECEFEQENGAPFSVSGSENLTAKEKKKVNLGKAGDEVVGVISQSLSTA